MIKEGIAGLGVLASLLSGGRAPRVWLATMVAGSVAARRLQHGKLQAYLLYLVIGLAVLAGLVLTGGGQ